MRRLVASFAFSAFFCILPLTNSAQTQMSLSELVNAIKSPYEGLVSKTDTSMLQTGYLIDQAVDFVSTKLFNGSVLSDSSYVDVSAFRELFRTMNYAKANNKAIEFNADSIYNSLSSSAYIKLSSALFQYNYIVSDAITNDYSVHLNWQSFLGQIGFPQGDQGHPIENLSIVCGNRLDNAELSNNLLTFGLFTVKLETLVTPLFPKTFSIYVNIDRDRGVGTTVSTTTIGYTHYSRLFTPIVVPVMIQSHSSPGSINHFDIVPGSYLSTALSSSFLNNNPFLYISAANKVVFIPSASSFAVDNYNADFYSNPSAFGSPFYSYCFEEDAMPHDSSLSAYLGWVKDQQDLRIDNAFVLSGDSMTVSNKPSGVSNEEWHSSNTTIASVVTNSGAITVNTPGIVSLSYQASREVSMSYTDGSHHNQYRYYRKHRTVLAGFPAMTLSANYLTGNQYTVNAVCTSSDSAIRDKLDELAASGEIQYIWGYKNSDDSYTWTDTTSTRSFACTALPGVVTYVCLKLYNGPGRESTVNNTSIDRTSSAPFFYDPQQTAVSSNIYLSDYTQINSASVILNEYLAVWTNSAYPGTVPPPDNIVIGLETVPLTSSFSKTIGGETKTVYCFTFMGTTTMQNAISQSMSYCAQGDTTTRFVPIKIKNGTEILQAVYYPLVPMQELIINPL